MVPRTVGSEATNTIKLFVDNNSGSDTSAVCHETMDTAADTACHRLPKSTETTFAQILPIISAKEINKPVRFGLYLWKKQTKQKLIFVCVISVCLARNKHAVQGKLAFFQFCLNYCQSKTFLRETAQTEQLREETIWNPSAWLDGCDYAWREGNHTETRGNDNRRIESKSSDERQEAPGAQVFGRARGRLSGGRGARQSEILKVQVRSYGLLSICASLRCGNEAEAHLAA